MDLELVPMDEPAEQETDRDWDPGVYVGEERRQYARRLKADRRAEVRFGVGKADRRSGGDRRKGTGFWHSGYTV